MGWGDGKVCIVTIYYFLTQFYCKNAQSGWKCKWLYTNKFENKSRVHSFNTSRVYFFYKKIIEFGMDKISFLKTENLKRQC